jgi:cell division protein FtsQ
MSQAVLNHQNPSKFPLGVIIFSMCALSFIIFILGYVSLKLADPEALPITKISINTFEENFVNLDAKKLEDIVVKSLAKRGFLHINVRAVQKEMLRQPWVYKAIVQRSWRDKLVIHITEQKPVARWGAKELLNEQGEIFSPDYLGKTKDLVKLTGPDGTQEIMLAYYKEIAARLQSLGLGVSEILLTDRRAWTIYTEDGKALVLGREDLLNRLQRFLLGYPKGLASRWSEVKKVDLRYSNGLAVTQNFFL